MRTLDTAEAAMACEPSIAAVPRAAKRSVSRREIMVFPPATATSQGARSDRSVLRRESAFPAPDLEGRVFLRPFRDLAGRQDHALEQGAAAFEIEMLVSAVAGIGTQANRQYAVDHIHPAPLARIDACSGEILPATLPGKISAWTNSA